MAFTLHKHLRMGVIIGWVLAWNALFGAGMWIDGGFVKVHSIPSMILMTCALLGTAIFILTVLRAPVVSAWALRPEGRLDIIRKELWGLFALSGIMGAMAAAAVLSKVLQ